MNFVEFKQALEVATGLSRDALHIYAAVAIQLLAAAVTRRGIAHPLPWLCVLIAEIANEWADLSVDRPAAPIETWASVHDLWNTMLLPSLLLLVARYAPSLVRPRARQ